VYYANKVGEVIYILFYEGFSVGFPLASINEKQVRSVLSKPWMLDGAVEEMENYQVGVTAPPFHQWCRSVTVPYFDDNGSERFARNADGESAYVPSDMLYQEWKEKFVANGKNNLTNGVKSGIIKTGGRKSSVKIGDTDGMTKITGIKPIDFSDKTAIEKEINDFAEKYAYAEVEHALEISPTGNVYTLKGIKGNVNSEILDKDILRGGVSMHNHVVPNGGNMGDSFSKQDLGFAAEYKPKKQYLVSGERRNAFKYIGDKNASEIYSIYDKAYNKLLEKSLDGEIEIIWENEQTLKILSELLEGFKFYENF